MSVQCRKAYVSVNLDVDQEGVLHPPPRFIRWENGLIYEGVFEYRDKLALMMLCQQLAVSKSAAAIRLRQLGYIEDRPYREYSDPLEVW